MLWRPLKWWLSQIQLLMPPDGFQGSPNVFRTTWLEAAVDFEASTGYSLSMAPGAPLAWDPLDSSELDPVVELVFSALRGERA